MSSFVKALKFWSFLTLALISFFGLIQGTAYSAQTTQVIPFFGGKVVASVSWMSQPSTSKATQLKVELTDSVGHPYDIDPSLVSVGLFMPEMPDMGVEEQNVVSLNDASGSPVSGSFVATDVSFSMQGEWEVRLTLPNPQDQKQTEMKKFNQVVK